MIDELQSSFLALPLWVRLWMMLVLAPANMATLAFMGEPGGAWIAALSMAGMVFNMPVMWKERGFTQAMAMPHVVFWVPLMGVIVATLPEAAGTYRSFLLLLAVINAISLVFDVKDALDWWRGDT